MAVEARHLHLLPPQILTNRAVMVMDGVAANGNDFGTPTGGYGGVVAPLAGTTTATEAMIPIYGLPISGFAPAKNAAAMKSDSGLTYVPMSRKRPRDEIDSLLSTFPSALHQNNHRVPNSCGSFNFLGEEMSFQIQQQQLEIDRFIAQHTEKVRTEIEERRKMYSRRIAAAMEENIMKKLKAKEDEIEKIGKLNWALEERVKSLFVENQIWRDLAQTNEATANALRCNLEQVLAQVHDEQQRSPHGADDAALADDAQSCCGSNSDEIDRRTLAVDSASTHAAAAAGDHHHDNVNNGGMVPRWEENKGNSAENSTSNRSSRMCRRCEREESSVLLLPCRHLCLCTVCGSSTQTCPVCHSIKTASVHVNQS